MRGRAVQVNVKLFAILRDKAGVSELALDLPAGATVATAAEQLAIKFPALRDSLHRVAYAVNREYGSTQMQLHDGDELALIPPVSGGSA